MSAYKNLIIGGIEIPLRALIGGFDQDYEELTGIAYPRLANGDMVIQRAWPASGNYKLRTTIMGGGSLPAPLDGLDRGTAHEISCAKHRATALAAAVGNVVTLPAGRRADTGYAPVGYALVAGELVATPLVLVGNVATLTTVAGAQHYQVRYWPKFVGAITHKSSGRPWQAASSWTLTVEEI